MDYYTRKLKEIKKIIEENKYPTSYNPKEWQFRKKDTNCYAYALNIPVGDNKKRIWFPGCISNPKEDVDIYSSNELIDRLFKDLEYLNFEYQEISQGRKLEGFLLATYMIPSHHDCPIGFHISRLDNDKTWSEKPSWDGKVRKIKNINSETFERTEDGLYLVKTLLINKK